MMHAVIMPRCGARSGIVRALAAADTCQWPDKGGIVLPPRRRSSRWLPLRQAAQQRSHGQVSDTDQSGRNDQASQTGAPGHVVSRRGLALEREEERHRRGAGEPHEQAAVQPHAIVAACGGGLPWFMCRSCTPRPGLKWNY